MRNSTLLAFNAVCNLFFGLVLLIGPAWMLAMYGINLDAGGIYMAHMAGGAFLGFAVLAWLCRRLPGETLRLAILPALFVWFTAGILTGLYAQVTGVTNFMGWSTILLSAFFAASYGYHLVRPTRDERAQAPTG